MLKEAQRELIQKCPNIVVLRGDRVDVVTVNKTLKTGLDLSYNESIILRVRFKCNFVQELITIGIVYIEITL